MAENPSDTTYSVTGEHSHTNTTSDLHQSTTNVITTAEVVNQVYENLSQLSSESIHNITDLLNVTKLSTLTSFESKTHEYLTSQYNELYNETTTLIATINNNVNALYDRISCEQKTFIHIYNLITTINGNLIQINQLYQKILTLIVSNYVIINKLQLFVMSQYIPLVPFLPKSLFNPIRSSISKNDNLQPVEPYPITTLYDLIQHLYCNDYIYTVKNHQFLNIITPELINHVLFNKNITAYSHNFFQSQPVEMVVDYANSNNSGTIDEMSYNILLFSTMNHNEKNKSRTTSDSKNHPTIIEKPLGSDTNQMLLFPVHLLDMILSYLTLEEIFNLLFVSKEWYYAVSQSSIFQNILYVITMNNIGIKLTYSHSVFHTIIACLKQNNNGHFNNINLYQKHFDLLYTPQWAECNRVLLHLLLYPPSYLPSLMNTQQQKLTKNNLLTPFSTISVPSTEDFDQKIAEIYSAQAIKETALQYKSRFKPVLAEQYDTKKNPVPTISTHPHYSLSITYNSNRTYTVDIASIEFSETQCADEARSYEQAALSGNDNQLTICSKHATNPTVSSCRSVLDLHLHLIQVELGKAQVHDDLSHQNAKKHQLSSLLTKFQSDVENVLKPTNAGLLNQAESDEITLKYLQNSLQNDYIAKYEQELASYEETIANCNVIVEELNQKLKFLQKRQNNADSLITELSVHIKVLNKEINHNLTPNIHSHNKYILFLQQMEFQLLNQIDSIYGQIVFDDDSNSDSDDDEDYEKINIIETQSTPQNQSKDFKTSGVLRFNDLSND